MTGFDVERERGAALDPLALNLDQAVAFAADRGPAVAVSATSILNDDLVGRVAHDEAAASGLAVAQLDEFAASLQADLPLRPVVAEAQVPRSLGQPVEHGELWRLCDERRAPEDDGRDSGRGPPGDRLPECPSHWHAPRSEERRVGRGG